MHGSTSWRCVMRFREVQSRRLSGLVCQQQAVTRQQHKIAVGRPAPPPQWRSVRSASPWTCGPHHDPLQGSPKCCGISTPAQAQKGGQGSFISQASKGDLREWNSWNKDSTVSGGHDSGSRAVARIRTLPSLRRVA